MQTWVVDWLHIHSQDDNTSTERGETDVQYCRKEYKKKILLILDLTKGYY